MRKFFAVAITILFCARFVQGQEQSADMDSQISKVADNLILQIKASGKKKVTVLDFTDLQGNNTELGRFLAEQLSVSLVEKRDGFSVMDRANLKTILDEHKLTVEGLVDPENAKKLGQFSGVDAIILGNVISLQDKVSITIKVIATDTAEIVGAVKGSFIKSKDLEQLSENPAAVETPSAVQNQVTNQQTDVTKATEIQKNSKQMGDLLVRIKSLKFTGDQNRGFFILATVIFVNLNTSSPIQVALNGESDPSRDVCFDAQTSLINNRGDKFSIYSGSGGITGVSTLKDLGNGNSRGSFTEIPAKDSIVTTIELTIPYARDAGEYPPYRFQSEIFVGFEENGRYINVKKHNFVIDVDSASSSVTPNTPTREGGYNYIYRSP